MCTRVRTCRCCLGAGRCVGGGGQLGTRVLPGVGCPQATPDHHSTLSLSNLGLQLKKLSIFIAIKLFLCAQLGGLQGSWSEFPEQHQGAVYATPPQGSNAEKSRPPGTGCKGPLGGGPGGAIVSWALHESPEGSSPVCLESLLGQSPASSAATWVGTRVGDKKMP